MAALKEDAVQHHPAVIINVLGGPGVGKTTVAATLFVKMKQQGLDVVMVPEFAAELVRAGREIELDNQYGVSGAQYQRLKNCGSADFIVTDGPLVHGIYYLTSPSCMSSRKRTAEKIRAWMAEFRSVNVLVIRDPALTFDCRGRYQDAAGAETTDAGLMKVLTEEKVNLDVKTVCTDHDLSVKLQQVIYRAIALHSSF